MKHIYQCDHEGDKYLFVATSTNEASDLFCDHLKEMLGFSNDDLLLVDDRAVMLPDDKSLTLGFEDAEFEDEKERTQTCREWAQEEPVGYLAGTECF